MTSKVISIHSFRQSQKEGKSLDPVKSKENLSSQLAFPFDSAQTAWIFALDDLHGSAFVEKLYEVRPAVIIDFRYFRHFELPGTGADRPRAALAELNPQYIAEEIAPEKIGVGADAAYINESYNKAFAKIKSRKLNSPIFFLMHTRKDVLVVQSFIQSYLEVIGTGWTVVPVLNAEDIAL